MRLNKNWKRNMLETIKDKDSFIRQMLLVLASTMQTLVLATIVANFGWTHILTYFSYGLTALIFFTVYYLWKN